MPNALYHTKNFSAANITVEEVKEKLQSQQYELKKKYKQMHWQKSHKSQISKVCAGHMTISLSESRFKQKGLWI